MGRVQQTSRTQTRPKDLVLQPEIQDRNVGTQTNQNPLPTGSLPSEILQSDAPDTLRHGAIREMNFEDSDDLLQAYINDSRNRGCDSQRRQLYINTVVKRFLNLGQLSADERTSKEKKIQEIVTKLAKHDIFRKLLSYANEGTRRDFSKAAYSKLTISHLILMGVTVQCHVPFNELVGILEQATLSDTFQYPSRTDVNVSDFADALSKETEVLEMPSTAETNAQFRISTILKKIVDRIRQREIIVIGEELSLGFCGDEAGPVEVQYLRSDETVLSTFISGRLDYACFRGPSHHVRKAVVDGDDDVIEEALKLIRRQMLWPLVCIKFVDFMATLEQDFNKSLKKLGLVNGDRHSWDVFTLEAKHMNKRITFSSGISPATTTDPAVLPQSLVVSHTSDTISDGHDDLRSKQSHDRVVDVVDISPGDIPRIIVHTTRA